MALTSMILDMFRCISKSAFLHIGRLSSPLLLLATITITNDRPTQRSTMDFAISSQVLPTPSLVVETIERKKNEIMQHLRNNEVRKIGVYGMARVQKTSVAKLVNNKLLNGVNSFDILVWVTISRKCSVIELQKKIEKAMNVVITKDKDETLRAGMLFEILSKNGRFFLILDELWERFSLEKVRIPKSSEAKLVVTSQSLHVGQNLMNSVDLLPIARSIVECCASLPLVIVIVSSSMRGTLKEQLIKDWIGKGLIEEMGSMEANLDKGQAILRTLVENCC
ncbi:hypothetical protein GOBAR_AA09345 [Gossypium barbadense]|uniref:NB-ARC domain-containing protein n=1 Tax=Gossypium barbadense TaxID=3634 RepID=A0A2P5Y6T6_GOSBA|nr:hypothetical protein GOBAR_AA09345 [Gossypium barbadense]